MTITEHLCVSIKWLRGFFWFSWLNCWQKLQFFVCRRESFCVLLHALVIIHSFINLYEFSKKLSLWCINQLVERLEVFDDNQVLFLRMFFVLQFGIFKRFLAGIFNCVTSFWRWKCLTLNKIRPTDCWHKVPSPQWGSWTKTTPG